MRETAKEKIRQGKNKKGRNGLSKKQQKLIKAFLDPEVNSIAEAARIAGYFDTSNAVRGLQRTKGRLKELEEKLNQAGATDEVLAFRIAEGLHTRKYNMFGEVVGLDREQIGKYCDRLAKLKQYISGGSKEQIQPQQVNSLVVIVEENPFKKRMKNGAMESPTQTIDISQPI